MHIEGNWGIWQEQAYRIQSLESTELLGIYVKAAAGGRTFMFIANIAKILLSGFYYFLKDICPSCSNIYTQQLSCYAYHTLQ